MITVAINGTDRATLIEDISAVDNINSQVDSLDFSLLKTPGDTYTPEIGAEIVVTRNGLRIFAGSITSYKDSLEGAATIRYDVSATDYTFNLNGKLATERYDNQTIAYIINDLVTKYAPGFTTTSVAADIVIKSIAFNRINLSECFRKMADMVNYNWYVDYYKDIHFFASDGERAPFDAVAGNYINDSLSITRDISQIRNRVIVQGGEVKDATRTVYHAGNGTTATFPTQYKFATLPTVTVGGAAKTVGLDFKDNDLSFQCMWDFNQKVIRFTAGNIPADPGSGTNITISGEPLFAIVVNVPDTTSIETYGEREFKIDDKNIKSDDQAIDRAVAELKAYANSISEGSFDTYTGGLRSGQIIRVTDPLRGIDEDFVIQKVRYQFLSADATYDGIWSVELASLKTVGIITVLQKLLLKEDLTANELDTLIEFRTIPDSFTTADQSGQALLVSGPYNWTTGWACRTKITVDRTKVPSNQTSFPVYVDLSHLPAEFFFYVKDNGADIRVFKADAVTELPYELVSIDKFDRTGELFFKGDLSSTVNTDFYIYYGNSDAVAYARTDTYGSNNVWTGAHGIYHASVNAKDSSVNAKDGVFFEATQGAGFWNFPGHIMISESAATLAGTTALPFGKATGTNQRIAQSFVCSSMPSKQIDYMLQKLANTGTPTVGATIRIQADSAGNPSGTDLEARGGTWNGTGAMSVDVDFIFATSTFVLTAGTTYWLVLTYDTPSDTNYPNVAYDPSGTYGALKQYNGTTWTTVPGSLRFRIFKSGGVQFIGSVVNMSTQNLQMTVRLRKSDTTYESILSNGAGITSHFEVNSGGNNNFGFRANIDGQRNIASGVNTGDGTWRNYCWRLNATNQTLFVQGAAVGTQTVNTLSATQNLSWVGLVQQRLNGTYGQALNGQVKFIRIRPAQTDDFNLTESRNLDSPATFYSVSAHENIYGTPIVWDFFKWS